MAGKGAGDEVGDLRVLHISNRKTVSDGSRHPRFS
jgi:hypothetical protein